MWLWPPSTVYSILDYNVYIIEDNVVELPVDQHETFSKVLLDILVPKMSLKVISLDEAPQALGQ